MEDLFLTVRLLEASSKLKSASLFLNSLSQQEAPGQEAPETLKWVGEFLMSMDWSSSPSSSHITPREIEPQVTSIRPTFYSSLRNLGPALAEEKIQDQRALFDFLRSLYGFLKSPVDEKNRFRQIDERYARLGAVLLRGLSQAIIIQLNSPDLPSRPQFLNADYRLTFFPKQIPRPC